MHVSCTEFALVCSETAAALTSQPSEAASKEAAGRMQWGEAGNPVVALLQQHSLQTQTVDQIESTMAPEVAVPKGPAPKRQAWEILQKDDKTPEPMPVENMAQTHVVEKKGASPEKPPFDAIAQKKEEDKTPCLSDTHIVKGQDKDEKKQDDEGSSPRKDMDGKPITLEEPHKEDTTTTSSAAAEGSSSTESCKNTSSVVSARTVLDQLQDGAHAVGKAVNQQPLRDESVAGKESGAGQEGGAVVEDDLEIQEYEAMLEEEEEEEEGESQEEVVGAQEVLQEQEKEVDDS